MATKWNLEKYPIWNNKICTQIWKVESTENISWFLKHCSQKRGNITGYDGFKQISGTKIHVAVDCNSLPISIVISSANKHDSTKFVDVMESISDYLDDSTIQQIVAVYADKGYDSKSIREYLKSRNIIPRIPHRNFKTRTNKSVDQSKYNKTRYVVERFFAWLKCGFHRTRIRYERLVENYLGFINIASFLMYCRVLRWVVSKSSEN